MSLAPLYFSSGYEVERKGFGEEFGELNEAERVLGRGGASLQRVQKDI